MNRLRILVLAPDSNPEGISIPYVTYSHAAALAQLHDVALVVRSSVEDPVRRAKAPFRAIEVIRMPWLERIYAWSFRRIFRSNFASQAVTAFGYPFNVCIACHDFLAGEGGPNELRTKADVIRFLKQNGFAVFLRDSGFLQNYVYGLNEKLLPSHKAHSN